MIKSTLVLSAILVLFHYSGMGQVMHSIKQTADFFEVDKQQNIYLVEGTEVLKYSLKGELLYVYSNNINGEITSIDVSNPLRIFIFWQESNNIVFLNQQLAPISEPVNLYSLANIEVLNAGASSKNGFWAYIEETQSLNHINSQWVNDIESQNIAAWLQGNDIGFIRELNQLVYVGCKEKVLVFDVFGSYITSIHFKGVQNLYLLGSNIVYLQNGKHYEYNLNTKTEQVVDLDMVSRMVLSDQNNIYVLTEDELRIISRK